VKEQAKPRRVDIGVQRSEPTSIEANTADNHDREPVGAGAT